MLKKTLIASAIAAVAFNATAATLDAPTTTGTVNYASEQFGSQASTLAVAGMDATATYSVDPAGVGPTGTIAEGARAELTYTLTNGTFASNVRASDVSSTELTVNSIVAGGAQGDNFVTFEVQKVAGAASSASATLDIRDVYAPALAASGATVSLKVTSKNLNNPAGGDALPTAAPATPAVLGLSQDAVTLEKATSTVADNGLIDIEDNTVLVNDVFQAAIATASVDNTLYLADGTTTIGYSDFAKLSASTVGAFNSGDTAKFGTADMTVSGNTAEGELAFSAPLDSQTVVYTPKGDENLSPADFTTTFAVEPAAASWQTVSATVVDATSYDGQNFEAIVNAVPSSDNADVMTIRITNESAVTSTLFVQVLNVDGSMGGTFELMKLAGGETASLQAADIEALTGKWEGRANINFSASQDFRAYTVLRSSGVLGTTEVVAAQ